MWRGAKSDEVEAKLAKMLIEEYEVANVVEFEEG